MDSVERFKVRRKWRMDSKRLDDIARYKKRRADRLDARKDADDDVQWITMNGARVPIKGGQTKEEACKEFLAKQKRKELADYKWESSERAHKKGRAALENREYERGQQALMAKRENAFGGKSPSITNATTMEEANSEYDRMLDKVRSKNYSDRDREELENMVHAEYEKKKAELEGSGSSSSKQSAPLKSELGKLEKAIDETRSNFLKSSSKKNREAFEKAGKEHAAYSDKLQKQAGKGYSKESLAAIAALENKGTVCPKLRDERPGTKINVGNGVTMVKESSGDYWYSEKTGTMGSDGVYDLIVKNN